MGNTSIGSPVNQQEEMIFLCFCKFGSMECRWGEWAQRFSAGLKGHLKMRNKFHRDMTSTKLGRLVLFLGLFAFTARAQALELSAGGYFYVSVLEGNCPRKVDLWAVGPNQQPVHLGQFVGTVSRQAPVPLGTYRPGQRLYLWHEVTDPATGTRESIDIQDARTYLVDLDPHGGYRIDVHGAPQDRPLLSLWVYPAKPPATSSHSGESNESTIRGDTALGSVVVGPVEGQDGRRLVSSNPRPQSSGDEERQKLSPSGNEAMNASDATKIAGHRPNAVGSRTPLPGSSTRWPVLEVIVALVLIVTLRRSRLFVAGQLRTAGQTSEVLEKATDLEEGGRPEEALEILSAHLEHVPQSEEREVLIVRMVGLSLRVGRTARAIELLQGEVFPSIAPEVLHGLSQELDRRGLSTLAQNLLQQPLAVSTQETTLEPEDILFSRGESGNPVGHQPPHSIPTTPIPCPPSEFVSASEPTLSNELQSSTPQELSGKMAGSEPKVDPLPVMVPSTVVPSLVTKETSVVAKQTVMSVESPRPNEAETSNPSSKIESALLSSRGRAEPQVAVLPLPLPPETTDDPSPPPAHFHAHPPVGWVAMSPALPQENLPQEKVEPGLVIRPGEPILFSIGRARIRSRGLDIHGTAPCAFGFDPTSGGPTPRVDETRTEPMPDELLNQIRGSLASSYGDLVLIHSDCVSALLSATEKSSGRKVSLHVLSPLLSRNNTILDQFGREARDLQSLESPGLMEIYSVVLEDVAHMVLQPLTGALLVNELNRGRLLAPHEAVSLGYKLSAVLDVLHQKARIHGDLHPARLVGDVQQGYHLLPPLLGGLSCTRITALTGKKPIKALYHPPEARRDGRMDYRGDIYSLGVLLHEILTGIRPCDVPESLREKKERTGHSQGAIQVTPLSRTPQQTVSRSTDPESNEVDLPLLRSLSIPDQLLVLVGRCVRPDPGRRYQDCGVAREVLGKLHQEFTAPQRVILNLLMGLADLAETGLSMVQPKLDLAPTMADDLASFAHHFYNEETLTHFRELLAGQKGLLKSLDRIITAGQPVVKKLKPRLASILRALASITVQLEGLLGFLESGGPKEESVARQAQKEIGDLSLALRLLDRSIDEILSVHTVWLKPLVQEAADRSSGALHVNTERLPAELSFRCFEPVRAQRDLAIAFNEFLQNAKGAGASHVEVAGENQDGQTRIRVTISDDGHGVKDMILRGLFKKGEDGGSPLASPTDSKTLGKLSGASPCLPIVSSPHGLEKARTAIENLGGRIFLTNRSDGIGAEVRISLPTHRLPPAGNNTRAN